LGSTFSSCIETFLPTNFQLPPTKTNLLPMLSWIELVFTFWIKLAQGGWLLFRFFLSFVNTVIPVTSKIGSYFFVLHEIDQSFNIVWVVLTLSTHSVIFILSYNILFAIFIKKMHQSFTNTASKQDVN
jgi:hypothetical protein